MIRRAEMVEHGVRSAELDRRAIHQAERGHIGRAVALEERSHVQKAEMIGDAMRGPHMHMGPPVGAVVAAETAMVAGAAVKGAVVAEEVAIAHRQREIREAEMIAAASRYPVGYMPPPTVYVQPGMPGAYPAAYPRGAYPPPGAVYPPGAYPRYPYPY